MNSQTLHEYFTENHSRGIIDHAIRADVDDKGRVSFYIHPHGQDGNTLDFWVLDDTFWPKDELTPEEMIQVIKDTATENDQTVTARLRADPKLQAKLRRLLNWQEESKHSDFVFGSTLRVGGEGPGINHSQQNNQAEP